MPTALKLGPSDHGRTLTLEEFESADYANGFRYELIAGKLNVSPQPNTPEALVVRWLWLALERYAAARPDVINFASPGARVFVPDAENETCPEPDIAAYREFPFDQPFSERSWGDISPVLVVEVSGGDAEKDLERNVDLYFRVPSIREYWVIDIREDADQPMLIAHRRRGTRWVVRESAFGETYRTHHLPDFELVIDPRR